jgi:chromate transporter
MPEVVSPRDALRVWANVAINSFGGPAGQIAVMHKLLVEEKRWIGESRFLHALNYCMLLPGPEAQQLATYIGWLLHGTRGGLWAGALFVLPGFLSILALSLVYTSFHHVPFVEGLFYGLKAAVLAVVIEAVVRIGKRVLKNGAMRAIAVIAFVAIFFLEIGFPFVVLGAALVGLVGGRFWPTTFVVIRPKEAAGEDDALLDRMLAATPAVRPSVARTIAVAVVWLAVWLGPVIALALVLGPHNTFVQIGAFFAKAATVTFGGAYSVLAYVAQEAVERYHWLLPGEMLDGLGMAETTPGPLIQVVQFVGYLGAYRNPGSLPPVVAGILASVLTTWVTYAPSFLWIFVGAPWIEWLRDNVRLSAALSALTAAVVGAVLNLAVWLGIHVLFARTSEVVAGPVHLLVPSLASIDWAALAIAIGAGVALLRFHTRMIPTLLVAAAIGMALRLLVSG